MNFRSDMHFLIDIALCKLIAIQCSSTDWCDHRRIVGSSGDPRLNCPATSLLSSTGSTATIDAYRLVYGALVSVNRLWGVRVGAWVAAGMRILDLGFRWRFFASAQMIQVTGVLHARARGMHSETRLKADRWVRKSSPRKGGAS